MNIFDYMVKFFPILFIAYGGWGGYELYEEKTLEVEQQQSLNNNQLAQIKRVERELEEVKRFEENLEESKKRVQEVISQIETIQKQLPPEINDTEVNGTLSGIAENLKMINPSPLPKGEQNHNFYFSKDFNFDVEGTFLQGLIFFEKLENLSKQGRILNVKYVRFSESDSGDKRSRFKILKLSTIVEAFRYNPNYNPQ